MTMTTFLKTYVNKLYGPDEFYGVEFGDPISGDRYTLTEATPVNGDFYEVCLIAPHDAVCLCINRHDSRTAYNTIYETVRKYINVPSVNVTWI